MKYNKGKLRTRIRFVLNLLLSKLPYSQYPKFRISRDMTSEDYYEDYANDDVFLNVGSGEFFYHKRWVNLDLFEQHLVESYGHYNNYDLRNAKFAEIPYKNVSAIYFGHTIEHIPETNLSNVLGRFHECMKVGGVLRIVTPDADLIYNAYSQNDISYFRPYKSWFAVRGESNPSLEDYLVQLIATPKSRIYTARDNSLLKVDHIEIKSAFSNMGKVDFLNWLISGLDDNNTSGTDHLNFFNHSKLKEIAEAHGFEYQQSAFGQSKSLPMREIPLFDETVPFVSMYADLIKI